ncbi:hypothetical protein [Paenibacillus sacheonensis]|uniref:Uncharacterized protein n=1 Tax=Paenibacillus sacheonensis TaxID=742054 RepID=A0A7X5BZE9_9BACL|nr:hypothetical protein [Paenibacillus sacheonensis]MBM7569011.1 hypothetical protein [Paenibacillus sacheonensis]NBC72618.1 hypothetical protein [Paenibacillus sacheonensis]
MNETRQQILFLNLTTPDLKSPVIAWSLYDGAAPADALQMNTGDASVPPYASVLHAMRDGWNVLQVPVLPHYPAGQEHDTGHLPYEYVLERKVAIA